MVERSGDALVSGGLGGVLPVNMVLPQARSSPEVEFRVMDRQSTGQEEPMQSLYSDLGFWGARDIQLILFSHPETLL